MPLISTRGAASAQGFGEFAQPAAPVYIEDVFSTYLYTGNDATQSASTGISLSTNGGLVWTKRRNGAASHFLIDTVRGNNKPLNSNSTAAQTVAGVDYITPTTTGYTIQNVGNINTTGETYASWTFRKQAKFFDVVTYTGNGSNRTISHNLGSVPGCIIIKQTDTARSWQVYHRSTGNTRYLELNSTSAGGTSVTYWNNTNPTASEFTLGTNQSVNVSGGTYVAYLFAHDAGGFGLTGSDNVISCGSYTYAGGANPVITLGWEPQWLLRKRSDSTGDWELVDNMRGLPVLTSSPQPSLQPNLSAAESSASMYLFPAATGFQDANAATGATYIYIAIRRGPMKVPTSGTQIANPKGLVTLTSGQTVTTGFVTDMTMAKFNGTQEWLLSDRLRNTVLYPNTTDSEGALYGTAGPRPFDVQDGFKTSGISGSYALWGFRRAPGFMDVVCYTGTGVARTINHNLGVAPELIITKKRSASGTDWFSNAFTLGNAKYLSLNKGDASANDVGMWNNTAPTASVFSLGASIYTNASSDTYVAYLFATLAGVSKVGSYTGSGTTKQIDCGFTAGARFVLIKRTDSTGNWHLYDSGQGIVAGNDPYFLVNTSDGQYVGSDYVDTYSAGFELSSTAPAGLNANGGTYIFLAIA